MPEDFLFRHLAQVPRLSLNERDRRWSNIRQEMALKDLDCLLVFGGGDVTSAANMRYVTHVGSPGIAIFPCHGDPVVFGGLPHTCVYHRGAQEWTAKFHAGARPDGIAATLKEMGYEKGHIGVAGYGSQSSRMVAENVPYSSFLKIQKLLPEAVFSNEGTLLERLRMVKSEEEITMLGKAAEIADAMFQALVAATRAGKAECELYADMLHASLSRGGDLAMILLDSGKNPLLHGRGFPYSLKPVEKGEMVILEWHASYGGYQVGVEHSLSLGQPDPHYLEIHKVCSEVFDRLVENLRPGIPMKEAIEAMRKPVEDAGMSYVEVGIHGHGLASPEFPSVVFGGPNCLVQDHPMGKIPAVTIRENMVFGINIDISNPRWRPDTGLMCGDTVVVTKTGARKLTNVPVELTVV